MSPPPAKMSVLVGQHFACVRIAGRANLNSSVDFRNLLNELCQKGCSFFVLDLSECLLMDSTFLGVLAGFGLKLGGAQETADDRGIELLNPNPRIRELLENLGILHLFRIAQGPLSLPEDVQAREHAPGHPGREQVARASLEAHRTLMQINPANVARFKDVVAFLSEDLEKPGPPSA